MTGQPKFISRKLLLQQLMLYSEFITFAPYKAGYRLSVSIRYFRALRYGYPILIKYCLLTSELYHEVFSQYPEYLV